MRDCLFASRGYILGCTLCNICDHPVDTCERFKQMSMKEKTELLVYERGNRPMLHTSPGRPAWHWYLKEYLEEAGPGAMPNAVPWTSEFAKEFRARPDFSDIQAQWVVERDVDALPKDPAHGSFDAVRQLYWGDLI